MPDKLDERGNEYKPLQQSAFVDFDELLRNNDLDSVAAKITDSIYGEVDFMKKDTIDKFLDFVYFKVQTGNVVVTNMAFPTKRMRDRELEVKVIRLINVYLFPEIIFRLLKFFTRNMHDPDTNLYLANLIESDEIIQALYDTYRLFKKDIFKPDEKQRTLNVKRIQQFSARSENQLSSPLDKAAILKYVLEFIAQKRNISHIYTREDIFLSKSE
jgi:hypothetical protein